MQCMLTRLIPQLFQISLGGYFNFHLQSVSLVLFKAGNKAACRLPRDGLAACFAETTKLAYNLLLPFVLMPRFLGLFWWIQQIINKYISQRKVTLGVFQMRTVTYTLYQDLHHLEQHGLYLSVNVKSRNKCNIETKYFFLCFPF